MIPQFPLFKQLELTDRPEILAITEKFLPYSDYDFGSIWSWDFTGQMQIATLNGNLVLRFIDYITSEAFFTFIGNTEVTVTAETLLEYAKSHNIEKILKLIPAQVASGLDPLLFTITHDSDNDDYIISTHNLAEYPGPKYSHKRRAVNQFLRLGCDYSFKTIDLGDILVQSEIRDLFVLWQTFKNAETPANQEHEYTALNRCLAAYKELNLFSTGLYIDNELQAFWILGLLTGQYAISHFEKANTEAFQGIFPFLKRETSRILIQKDILWINLEQDLGIPGLRQSKQSYIPDAMVQKFIVSKN